mgnify:CR=1 FL=1
MNQFEINQIKSRLRRLELPEDFVDQYVHKLQIDCEIYSIASKTIDRWEKEDNRDIVAQVLVCGFIAAVLGGFLATL